MDDAAPSASDWSLLPMDTLSSIFVRVGAFNVLMGAGLVKRLVGVVKQSPLLELRSLKLNNTYVTVQELTAVLENCPVLEVLRVHNCFEIDVDEEEHALRAKFARTMTIWCDDDYRLYFD
ncbi:hypothetical protein ZWY2020_024913 [Hordeum vulgare]|nr:hypothetical protein ZWY2020_024913 [Hordeum vulgare]